MSTPRRRGCPLNEQAVGWALHALEPDEEMAVLRHLPQCPSCRTAVQEAEEVLSRLGASVEQVDPPASLRDSLLSRVSETPQRPRMLRPSTNAETFGSGADATSRDEPGSDRDSQPHEPRPIEPGLQQTDPQPADSPPADPGPVVPRPKERRPSGSRPSDSRPSGSPPPGSPTLGSRSGRRSWLSRRGRSLVAASLALVGILTVGGLAVRTAQLEQQRDAQAQSIAELVSGLDQPGSRHALLAREDGTTVAAVLVTDGQPQVFTVGLPPNSTDRSTYVLWAMHAGADPRPVGTFDIAEEQGLHTVGSVPEPEGVIGFAISIEPGRTSPAAPSTVVASGQMET